MIRFFAVENVEQFLIRGLCGEADLVAGGFTRTAIGSGKGVRYSLKNWGARWQVDACGGSAAPPL